MAGRNSSVVLIDPNEVVSQFPEGINGAPDYSGMFVFAELVGYRKARSVLISSNNNVRTETNFSDTTINMMGFDQDTLQHTTRWTETINNSVVTPYEGFGITNIKIEVNSSYVPVVNIDFVDIKGLALFNLGKNSPYSLLHDFPPPLFKLTVKGYYGRALQYDLHLKKQFTRFDSETGNYHTSVEFVGRTFAPLSDVIFKYIEIFPFIFDETANPIDSSIQFNGTNPEEIAGTASSDVTKPPKNTFDFLLKAKSLYDNIREFRENSEENQKIENFQSQTFEIDGVFRFMNNFAERLDSTFSGNDNVAIVNYNRNINDTEDNYQFIKLRGGVGTYNSELRNSNTNNTNGTTTNGELHLAVKSSIKPEISLTTQILGVQEESSRDILIRNQLTTIKEDLLRESRFLIDANNGDVKIETILNVFTQNNVSYSEKYITLNVTSLYNKLYKKRTALEKDLQEAQEELRNKTIAISTNTLGMVPTIYNTFKIMCDDVDLFFNILRSVAVKAAEHHERYKDQILGNAGIPETRIYPFPLYIKETSEYGNNNNDIFN
ncbi:MAG: hypothetical protein ACOCV1_06150, partial [Bacillota bacterium]